MTPASRRIIEEERHAPPKTNTQTRSAPAATEWAAAAVGSFCIAGMIAVMVGLMVLYMAYGFTGMIPPLLRARGE
jgi:hypothetical protein